MLVRVWIVWACAMSVGVIIECACAVCVRGRGGSPEHVTQKLIKDIQTCMHVHAHTHTHTHTCYARDSPRSLRLIGRHVVAQSERRDSCPRVTKVD
jgi:uncharacterized protein YqfA (UPF0365 family)